MVLWGSRYTCWCLNALLRKEEIRGDPRSCSVPHRPHCSEACRAPCTGRAVCPAGKQGSLLHVAVCSPKRTPAAPLAEELLRPVPGTSHRPCQPQPRSPTRLFLFKRGVFLGLPQTGLCRPAKCLAMCVGHTYLVLALAVPLQPWQRACACCQSFPVIPQFHHELSLVPAANSTPRAEAEEG